MKKTILKTAMLAAIASLAMSANVAAHHPVSALDDTMEQLDGLYERIDANISDMHNEIVGDVEDYEFMGNVMQSSGAEPTPTATAGDANAASTQTSMSGDSPAANVNVTGISNQGATPSLPPAIPRPGMSNQTGTGSGSARTGR